MIYQLFILHRRFALVLSHPRRHAYTLTHTPISLFFFFIFIFLLILPAGGAGAVTVFSAASFTGLYARTPYYPFFIF